MPLKIRLNARQIITDLGGVTALSSLMHKAGCPVSSHVIEKWKVRDSIPSRHLVALIGLSDKGDLPIKINQYITGNEQ
jgi:hypothetical protein